MTQENRNLNRLVKRFGFSHVVRDKDKKCWRIFKYCGQEHGYGHRDTRSLYAALGSLINHPVFRGTPLWQERRELGEAMDVAGLPTERCLKTLCPVPSWYRATQLT